MDILPLIFSGILDKSFIFYFPSSSIGNIIIPYKNIVTKNGINLMSQ